VIHGESSPRRRILGIAFLAVYVIAVPVHGADGGFGIGMIIGDPTGISMKKWLSSLTAIDAAAAWSFTDHDAFQLHLDYLFHNENILRTDELSGRLLLYYGIGGRFKLRDDDPPDDGRKNSSSGTDAIAGVRIPLGITYLFRKSPFDLFIEVVPTLDVSPETEFDLDAAVGGRFYFR
jgi:hypothetical protein